MPIFVTLFRFTEQGIQAIRESPARVEAVKKMYAWMGATVKDFYALMGQYDTMIIAEAPDDETMARISLAIGSLGNVRTETLRAFTEEEYRKIVLSLP